MAGPFTTSSCASTSCPTCLGATPNLASPFSAANHAGTSTIFATCQNIFRPTSRSICSTHSPPNPHPFTSPSTTSLHHRNASRSTRSQDIVRGRGEASSRSCTKPIGPDLSVLHGNVNKTYKYHRLHILRYWSSTPSQHRQSNRLHRQMRVAAAHRELARTQGEIFLALGYRLVPRTLWLQRFSSNTTLPVGAHLWYQARDGLSWLGKVTHRTSTDNSSAHSYIVRSLDDPGPSKINLLSSPYTTSRSDVHGPWVLQHHQARGLARGVLRNADGPRGTPLFPLSMSGNWRQPWF